MSAACHLNTAENLATCKGGMTSGTFTEQYTDSAVKFSEYIQPVTVTAGFENTSAGAGGAATTTAAQTGATSSSTGGVGPRCTGNAVVMGAAAAVVGGAAWLI